jgi:hypothetical protein
MFIVEFNKAHRQWFRGEQAGFPDDIAKEYEKRGLAKIVREVKERSPEPDLIEEPTVDEIEIIKPPVKRKPTTATRTKKGRK